ncbi:MAG: GNAT family N-acetyltransferase [Vicingaceae bacterium]
MSLVHFQYAEPRHIYSIESLASRQFGRSYMTSDQIANQMTTENHFFVIALKAEEVLGFIYFIMGDLVTVERVLKVSGLKALKEKSPERKICIIKTVAVMPTIAGQGIGTGLTMFAFDQNPNASVIGIIWKRKSLNAFEQIMLKLGGKKILEIKGFWKDDSLKKGYKCPECGEPPCNCKAVVYYKK